jgi:hypothetical protein
MSGVMSKFAWAFAFTAIPLLAQRPLWEVPGAVQSNKQWANLSEFRDFDGDGTRDMLVRYIDRRPGNYFSSIEILSGRTGGVLWGLLLPSVIDVRDAGDTNGDGHSEVLLLYGGQIRRVQLWSTRTSTMLWSTFSDPGANSFMWGDVLSADIDLNGDGRRDFLIGTINANHSTLYAYDHTGTQLWSIDYRAQGRYLFSASRYGDFNGDGIDDFLLGLQGDAQGRGIVAICSGLDGSYLRESLGVQPTNYLCDHVRNVGDIDGDGVHDYAGFPAWFTFTGDCAIFSGADGSVLRTWIDYAESVVGGPDFDLDRDGVPDLLICNEQYIGPSTYGRARAISGRDGAELWNVDAVPYVPGGGVPGAYGWGRYSVPLGTLPGHAYPSVAWMEMGYYLNGNWPGRVRAFGGEHINQSRVRGEPCASTGGPPLIGVRKTTTGARVTLAKAPSSAFAVLAMSTQLSPTFGPYLMPLELAPLGLPGCLLHVVPQVAFWRITGSGPGHDRGYAFVDLPFALSATAAGIDVFAQWLVLDPVSLEFAATELHVLRGQ